MQLQSIPFVYAVLDGRPAPLLQDVIPLEELRTALTQVTQQLTAQGMTGRHQPRASGAVEDADDAEEQVDPRYAPAQDALGAGDYAGAVTAYQALLSANPSDAEAAAGLAMATLLLRTDGVDPAEALAAADAAPDDVDAQTLAADLDLLSGRAAEAFTRLVELVRRTSGAERDAARGHLIGMFNAVGNDDPRVLRGRRGPGLRTVLIPAQVTRTRGELAIGVWCVLLGAGLFVWLGADLVSTDVDSGWAVVARFAAGCFWWALAASMLLQRWHRLGLLAAATCVAVLLLALAGGLLLDPGGFVRPGGVAPHTTTQARAVGAVVLLVLVAGGGWLGRRRASDD